MMKYFDKGKNMKLIRKEFETIEQFNNEFLKKFSQSVFQLINKYFPADLNSDSYHEALEQYATHVLNATFSVIDKDKSYPEYRINEELNSVKKLASKQLDFYYDLAIENSLHKTTKETIFKYFPQIIDLSGNGFRLLEANSLMYTKNFIAALHFNKLI